MTDSLPNLNLPLIQPSQAQKHITHNEALSLLDTFVQLSVISDTLDTPPAVNADGDRYLVAPNAQQDWQTHDGQIASFDNNVWQFFTPQAGWRSYVQDQAMLKVFDGSTWSAVGANTDHLSANNLTLNKASSTDDAGLILQTDTTPYVVQGLFGSDNYRISVSSDGSNFQDGLVIDQATGITSLPQKPRFSGTTNFDNFGAVGDWIKVAINELSYNEQGAFDAVTNLFTTPIDGLYHLGGRLMFKMDQSTATRMNIRLMKNGTDQIPGSFSRLTSGHSNNLSVVFTDVLTPLQQGDTVELQGRNSVQSAFFKATDTIFWGYLV